MERVAARFVHTLEGSGPIVDGFVEYTPDGTVAAVGRCEDPSKEERFLEGAIVPGFVNTHCHVELSYMRGLFRKGTGMAGFIDQINALRDTRSMEEKVAEAGRWMDIMWKRGVSAMADISNCADSFAPKKASPMYTRTFLEVFGTEPEDCPSVMENVMKLKAEAESFGLDAAPTPHACYTMSPELLTAACKEGLRSGFLSYHSEETQEEEDMVRSGCGAMWDNRKAAGMSVPPVGAESSLHYFLERLSKAHPAPFGENILLVHEVCMTQEGIDAVKAVLEHPFVALCPCSNLFIHRMLPPVDLMRSNGMKITVGTDSLSSNDDLDIIRELFCLQENFKDLEMDEMLLWACRNGAEFLGKEGSLGTIVPGKAPGLVFVDNLDAGGRLTSSSTSHRIV